MATQNVKTISAVELSPSAHTQLVQLANLQGIPIKTYAGKLIEELLSLKTQQEIAENPHLKARAIFYQMELAQERYANARAIAAVYQENPTEENADMFYAYCEMTKIDPKSFISALPKNDPLASILTTEIRGKSFKQAVVFLVDLFAKSNGEPILSQDILKKAELAGINQRTLERAKRYINRSEESQIVSVRLGKGWAWAIDNPALPEPDPESLPDIED